MLVVWIHLTPGRLDGLPRVSAGFTRGRSEARTAPRLELDVARAGRLDGLPRVSAGFTRGRS